MEPPMVWIYTLSDPQTGEVRYVGQTTRLNKRFNVHLSIARHGSQTALSCWIRGLLASGEKPIIHGLEQTSDPTSREQHWLHWHLTHGCVLLNRAKPRHSGRPRIRHSKHAPLVYSLRDPKTGVVYYVGITMNIHSRLDLHQARAKANKRTDPVYQWIRSLQAQGLRPEVTVLEENAGEGRECWWIAHFRSLGHPLTNTNEGGTGWRVRSESHRAKLLISQKQKKVSAATRVLLREANQNVKLTPEQREEIKTLRATKGLSYYRLGNMFSVLYACVRNLCIGKSWAEITP